MREFNEFYILQKSPEEILAYMWGNDNPFKTFDAYIERPFNSDFNAF